LFHYAFEQRDDNSFSCCVHLLAQKGMYDEVNKTAMGDKKECDDVLSEVLSMMSAVLPTNLYLEWGFRLSGQRTVLKRKLV
jgi:hypothetical protein